MRLIQWYIILFAGACLGAGVGSDITPILLADARWFAPLIRPIVAFVGLLIGLAVFYLIARIVDERFGWERPPTEPPLPRPAAAREQKPIEGPAPGTFRQAADGVLERPHT
jgi:hypothetical protein